MASTIPPPPFLGPLEGVPVKGTYDDWVNLFVLRWNDQDQAWASIPWGVKGWQQYPLGYYVSEHQAIDGDVDYGAHTTVIVVTGRSDPQGVAQPFVLEQPPAGQAPDPRCPPNMWWTNVGDTFNTEGGVTLCSWLPGGGQPTCPPGTHWDAATETCVADVTIPPIILPPPPPGSNPPPPPPETGQPDPQGDELTYEVCLQMKANADAIVFAINQLQGALGGDPAGAAACCANVVTAINLVSRSLLQIFTLLNAQAATPAPPITFSPNITIDVAPPPPAQVIIQDDPNVKRIADDFDTLDDPSDPDGDAFIDYLVEQGALDSALGSKLKGSQ